MSEINPEIRMLRVKDVAVMVGIGVSTVWLWVKEGKFPKPIKYSAKITVWRSDDVQAFIENVFSRTKVA